jgi:hypothetical protein
MVYHFSKHCNYRLLGNELGGFGISYIDLAVCGESGKKL